MKSNPQPPCFSARPEEPLTLSANVQDEIQTNFLSFPFIFRQIVRTFTLQKKKKSFAKEKKKPRKVTKKLV